MTHVHKELKKLAAEAYDTALERPDHFTVDELTDRFTTDLLERLDDETGVIYDLITYTARSMIEQIDKNRTRPDPQDSLLDCLDRPVAIGGGERVARRHMRDMDWAAHMANVNGNAARVTAAASKENARYSALLPYLSTGVTTIDAVAAWQVDHPDEVLP